MSEPTLTVVVCTYNRAELLAESLEAIVRELEATPAIELVVVDNNSSDETPEVAAAKVRGVRAARVVREPAQGLSHARNRGLAEASAPWVAYVDDDALVERGWAARALATIADGAFDAFGGVYVPWYKYGRPRWFRDSYASNAGIAERRLLGEREFFSGGNAVLSRRALDEVGGFSSELGMKGAVRAYGEETAVQIRMRARGLRIGFDPELIVRHVVAPQKLQVRGLLANYYAAGRDYWRTFEHESTWLRRASAVGAGFAVGALRLPTELWRLRRADYYVENALIEIGGPAMYGIGQLAGRGARS